MLGQARQNVNDDVDGFISQLKTWLLAQNPEPIFAILRRLDPILIVKHFAVVTRYDDVQEVLSRDNVFHVPYAQHFDELTGGKNFFLGMENTPEYTRDVATMRLAIRRDDIANRIMPFVEHTADDIVAHAGGRMDVVKELGNIVPSVLVAEYIGTPSPTPSAFAEQSAAISGYLFIPEGQIPSSNERPSSMRRSCVPCWRSRLPSESKTAGSATTSSSAALSSRTPASQA